VAAWRAIKTMAIAGLIVGVPGYALGQGQPGVGVVTALVGEATVTRAAMAQGQVLRKRDDVYPKDRITTKEHSLVHVLMGGKALLTVRELSVVTVTEESGRATVDLQSGKVGLAVVRERMRPGEIIEVITPHAVAAVRGTVLVVEVVPDADGGDRLGASTNVHLLHGKLDVSLRSNPGAAFVRLETLQSVTVSGNALGAVRPLSPMAAAAVTANLKTDQPAPTALPEKFQSALDERQQVLAVAAIERAVGRGMIQRGQGAKALAGVKGLGIESGSARDPIEVVSDAAGGIGAVSVSGSGSGSDGGTGGGKGSGQFLVSGSTSSGGGLTTVVPPVLKKKKD